MSYNGSGTFNINSAGQPVVTGTVISSTAFNALTADLGTGLSTAITKDGQTVATARIPFAAGINSSLVTDATNTTTGSIITAGGVGIAKAVFVGTTLNVAGASTLAGITGSFNGTVGATTPAAGSFTTVSATGSISTTIASKTAAFDAVGGSIYSSYNDATRTWRSGVGIMSAGRYSIYDVTGSTEVVGIPSTGLAVTGTLSSTTGANFATSSGNVGIGTSSPQARVTINQSMNIYGNATYAASAATGQGVNFGYDGNTEQSWIQALRNNTSELRTLQLNPLGGTVTTGAALTVGGALSKASGSFRISHPLPALTETHELVHSFIEGPQADLIYRGKVNLIAGKASVNIDTAARMTEGTFVVLCREVQCFTTNESGWNHVRGSVVGNVLTIDCQDQTAADLVSWMVIGERQDPHMYETYWTDENGKVIVEPLKPQVIPVTQDAPGVTDVTEEVMK